MALVRIVAISQPNSAKKERLETPTTEEQMAILAHNAFRRVGRRIYGLKFKKLPPGHVSVLTSWAGLGSLSGYSIEITVELASDDWPRRKSDYEKLAKHFVKELASSVPHDYIFHVWVKGGRTGFAEGKGAAEVH